MPESQLAAQIEAERRRLGWSRRQMALNAKVSPSTIEKIIRDNRLPDLPTLAKIADGLNVPLATVLAWCGYPVECPHQRAA